MQAPVRVVLAVGGGYLLGRTKKLKLAITLGSYMAGKKLSGPNGLLGQGVDLLQNSPEFDRLREQLMGAGKTAVVSAAASQMGRLTDRIESRGSDKGNARDDDEDYDDAED
ncbi:MAG: hypothetical protein QOG01_4411, partial [Pseudonocardiales bacterium]|nr:hypothetical protein [Pseudonocardiales bacterium]